VADVEIIVRTIDQSTANTKKIEGGLDGLAGKLSKVKDVALAAAPAIAVTMKAFDFAQQGANISVLREGFEGLGFSIEELRKAAGGTVSDLDLMASANKLVAGTTGELRDRMSEAAPQLLEVARAAVKLDPTIGSVGFVFESLAKGIKKNQPLLIDNANIAVKVGQANEVMAAQLGKTVSELTEEEKAMALLNDTLRAGDALLQQVGGSADSSADSWARLTVMAKNAGDSFKEWLGSGLTPLADSLLGLQEGVDKFSLSLLENSDSFEEYRQKVDDASFAQKAFITSIKTEDEFNAQKAALLDTADAIEQVTAATIQLGRTPIGFDFESATTANMIESQMQSMFDKLEFSLNPDAIKIAGDVNLLQALIGEGKIDPAAGLAALEELKTEFAAAMSEEGLGEGIVAGLTGAQFDQLTGNIEDQITGPLKTAQAAAAEGVAPALSAIDEMKFENARKRLEDDIVAPMVNAKTIIQEFKNSLEEMASTGYEIPVTVVTTDAAGVVLPEAE